MDPDLIVEALRKACGNKHFRFQAIFHKSKLHIYINRKTDCATDYILLADTIRDAIASLGLDSIKGIWLYSRKLGEVDPDWQFFLESPGILDEDAMDTLGLGNLPIKRSPEENFAEIENSTEDNEDTIDDTGLLKDTGLIHSRALEEEEINTIKALTEERKTEIKETNNLAEYCFVNRKILTGDIIPPQKEIIRLVKFFHHLSPNNQEKILPHLANFFSKSVTPEAENFPVAVQKWLKQISDLNIEQRNTLAIWLSRYCFDSTATLAEFKAIEERKKSIAKKNKRSNIEYDFTPANYSDSSPQEWEDFSEDKFQLPAIIKKSLIPLIWTLATVIFICLGMYSSQKNLHFTSQDIPSICKTSIGSPNYCRLGVNLAGKQAIEDFPDNIFPLSIITETVADYGCQRFANVKAEAFKNLDPKKNPVIESHGEKIFPHIYVVEALQKNVNQPGNVRVGCVYATGEGERSPKKLASDIIPINWPEEHYQPEQKSKSTLSFGVYTNLINLGLYTLFSTFALLIVVEFKLGIVIYQRPQAIYLFALGLGFVQSFALILPWLNLFASLLFSIATIIIYDRIFNNFKLKWQDGNPMVAAGILTILAIQFVLYGLSLNIIHLALNI